MTASDDSIVIYNGFTGAYARVQESNKELVKQIVQKKSGISESSIGTKLLEDLKYGGFIVEDGFDERAALHIEYLKYSMANDTVYLTLIPTTKCNFKCKYCFEAGGTPGTTMTAEAIEAFINWLDSMPFKCVQAHIFGGEPLLAIEECITLAKGIKRISDKHSAVMTSVPIITNGYNLTAKVAIRLVEAGVGLAQITIDGDREQHDKRRMLKSGGGTFDRIMENILEVNTIMRLKVRINYDKDEHSNFHELQNMFEKAGVDYYFAPTDYKHVGDKCTYTANQENINAEVMNHSEEYLRVTRGGCAATCLGGYAITPEGDVLKCWEEIGRDISYGNIMKNSVVEIQNAAYKWLEASQFNPDNKCYSCKMLPNCGGGCALWKMNNKEPRCKYASEDEFMSVVKGVYDKSRIREEPKG